jgi:WD40 repeat protein
VRFLDVETWALRRSVPIPAKVVDSLGNVPVAFSSDMVAVGTEVGTVLIVDAGGAARTIAASGTGVRSVALTDSLLAVGDVDGTVHLIELATGAERWATGVMQERTYAELIGPERWSAMVPGTASSMMTLEPAMFRSGPAALRFTPDGALVVVAGAHLRRLDVQSGRVTADVAPIDAGGFPRVYGFLAVGADGTVITAGGNKASVFDATFERVTLGAIPTGRDDLNLLVRAVVFDGSGRPWFGLNNGQLAHDLAETPRTVDENPSTGLSDIRGLSIGPGGGTLLAAGAGGIVVWSIDGRQLIARAVPRGDHAGGLVTADGNRVVLSTLGSRVPTAIYDLASDPATRLDTTALREGETYGIFDPRGRILEGFGSGTERLLDAADLSELAVVDDVSFIAWSLDGRLFAAARWNEPGFRVRDTSTWTPVSPMLDLSLWARPEVRNDVVPGFDTHRNRVFASLQETGATVVYDSTTWQIVTTVEAADHGGVVAATFSHDGDVLVTLGLDGTIAQRDPETWAFQRTIPGGASANDNLDQGVHLSRDGEYLLTTRDGHPRLWHVPTGIVIGSFPHRTGMLATGNDDGDQLRLVTLGDEHALVWNLDVTSWPEIACRAAGRNLTVDEWAQFGPKGEPHTATCAQWPAAA